MTPKVGDIIVTPKGRKWRILAVGHDFVRAQEVETGVVSHLELDDVTVIEAHPGGRR